ncbi:uncharacterized protein B0H18DRAFT_870765 [Fomitopsis serialis]|uniref:uncharacterized protein n=1 Tax=Fomitopsis serialis TaxID=139415 RepID=UPI0020085CA6|nr:uncharacterized protein B0H18DRAFT_870765 [Neoantrodia serialis]KAH9933063.1 hypothetical protein B0H18DRAFT_870765 [Neoantrodia serialis]
MLPPTKRRRTATSVLAGDFDPRPARDVLTSLLNGVPINKEVERAEELRRERRRKEKEREREKEKEREKETEKERERERERKRAKSDARPQVRLSAPPVASTSVVSASGPSVPKISAPVARSAVSSFWQARPAIHITNMQRSVSVTPPPMASSPPTTPGPSNSSTTSATSSKRPHTPYDDDDDDDDMHSRHRSEASQTPPYAQSRPRKKRTAVRKGWKGWVEGSPPPSEKLINLDTVSILPQRKTRSGKSFDAIGLGEDTWV